MLLRDKALIVLKGLSVDYGAAWAHEWYKRRAVGQRWRRCGERSFSRVERQLEKEGWVIRRPIWPGDRLPNGKKATKRAVRVIVLTRQQWRKNRRDERKAAGRKPSPPPRPTPRPRAPEPPPAAPSPSARRRLEVGLSTVTEAEQRAHREELARILGPGWDKPKPR